MERKQVDSSALRLVSIPFRQQRALQEKRQLLDEWAVGNLRDEPTQTQHRRRIALVRALLGADLHHELRAAQSLDDLVDRGDRDVVALLAFIRLETRAV